MKLGLSASLEHRDADHWAGQLKSLGCESVNFPIPYDAPEETIRAYVRAARDKGLVIAEVGIWKNVLAIDPKERAEARAFAEGQLRLADEIGALCCVNVAGTYGGPHWCGAYRENFSSECWEETVRYCQELIDKVKPSRTKFCLEQMPWMIPTGPDETVRLLEDVNREAFGVHLDMVNMVNSPERYFFLDEFMEDCFGKLGDKILSCHLKDIRLKEEFTFQLEETKCGLGTMNIKKHLELVDRYNSDMPVIIEHLDSDEAYKDALRYVQELIKTNH